MMDISWSNVGYLDMNTESLWKGKVYLKNKRYFFKENILLLKIKSSGKQ